MLVLCRNNMLCQLKVLDGEIRQNATLCTLMMTKKKKKKNREKKMIGFKKKCLNEQLHHILIVKLITRVYEGSYCHLFCILALKKRKGDKIKGKIQIPFKQTF